MHPEFIILSVSSLISILICLILTHRKQIARPVLRLCWTAACMQLLILFAALFLPPLSGESASVSASSTKAGTNSAPVESSESVSDTIPAQISNSTVPSNSFSPEKTEHSLLRQLNMSWEIEVNGQTVGAFSRGTAITFEPDQIYFALPGISTFRGDNYRANSSYGLISAEEETMDIVWSHRIGNLNKWGGCAWTGQPLVVQWDQETKAVMKTMYESKRNKENLVEVIYATLDGYIHFYDLDDGTKTREPINMGMNFKGAGTLDPRGYPLLYVGAGLYINGAAPRMFVVNLITGKIIYQYGYSDSFALRDWSAFDASPLVDAETDTLIWPGENGVLYTIHLNTHYDPASGTVSIDPDEPVKTRYTSDYSETGNRHLGYESSPVIVDHYLYATENGGLLQCIDLNTMDLIWVQDLGDDADSTPVFEWGSDGRGYLYCGTCLHWTVDDASGTCSVYKIDASTGEILWRYQRNCFRCDDIAGGIMGSPVLGKPKTDIDGLLIYAIGNTPNAYQGVLVALDTDTGEKIWEISTGNYAWSSPIALYTDNADAYLFLSDASGHSMLIDGSTGEVLDTLELNETVEASAVAFGNMLVIGSRTGVYGIRIE